MFTFVGVNNIQTVKYKINKFNLINMADNIHPVWLIEVHIKILLREFWLTKLIDPANTGVKIINSLNILTLVKYEINIMSAVFYCYQRQTVSSV